MEIINPTCRSINLGDLKSFIESVNKLNLEPTLSIFKDKNLVTHIAETGKLHFKSLIKKINDEINDPHVGISVLDVPTFPAIGSEKDTFLGILCSLSIIWNLITPAIDSANLTPFTVYTASKNNGEKLSAANLTGNVPEVKLGFHNDGHITDNNILVPNMIAIYNILIAYQKPGEFHWVPFSKWDEMRKFANLFGIGKKYKFRIVPNVYSSNNQKLDIHGPSEIIAPIFTKKANGELMMFMNGEVIGDEYGEPINCDWVRELKNSISANPFRYSIEQKVRRLILLGNTQGCHARDVFEEPMDDSKLTRAFMRSVDKNGIPLIA